MFKVVSAMSSITDARESQPLIVQGKPRFGRFGAPPAVINVADFDYRTPYGQPVSKMGRWLGFKQFHFISLNNADLMVGIAQVDLGWVGHGFFYVHERSSGKTLEFSFNQPLGFRTHLDATPQHGKSVFRKGWFSIQIVKRLGKREVEVRKLGRLLLKATLLEHSCQPLALCTPTAANGWTYTQKSTALPVSGTLNFNGKKYDLSRECWLGATDDSCGMLRRETAWHWLSLSTRLPTGELFGINLATGVNETYGSENSAWLNGVLQELPPVLFEQREDYWSVRSADERVKLRVTTGWSREESLNLGVVGSHFNQWVSQVSGTITLADGKVIRVDAVPCLLEKHFAKW